MATITQARSRVLHKDLGSPALGGVANVLAATASTGSDLEITAGLTDPPTARNVTASSAGTTNDIKAVQVLVTGTNSDGDVITETLPVFTVNTATTVVGSKAFATVTQVDIPTHDGNGATTSVGLGAKLGLGSTFSRDTVIAAFQDGVLETTRPTVAFSSSAVESNTVDLNTAMDGDAVLIDYYIS